MFPQMILNAKGMKINSQAFAKSELVELAARLVCWLESLTFLTGCSRSSAVFSRHCHDFLDYHFRAAVSRSIQKAGAQTLLLASKNCISMYFPASLSIVHSPSIDHDIS
jgi:hypothetical protein